MYCDRKYLIKPVKNESACKKLLELDTVETLC